MKAKVLKDLINKLQDDDEVLLEYSGFLFGEYREPKIYSGDEQVRNAVEEYFDDEEEVDELVGRVKHVICFRN